MNPAASDSHLCFPRFEKGASLYFHNSMDQTTQELHLQLFEYSANQFQISTRSGHCGNPPQIHPDIAPLTRHAAEVIFQNILTKYKNAGYTYLNFRSIGDIYATMQDHAMHTATMDLFINHQGSLLDIGTYLKQTKQGTQAEFDQIHTYANIRAATTILINDFGGAVSTKQLIAGLSKITQQLEAIGLGRAGVFVGHQDSSHHVYQGIPFAHYHRVELTAENPARRRHP